MSASHSTGGEDGPAERTRLELVHEQGSNQATDEYARCKDDEPRTWDVLSCHLDCQVLLLLAVAQLSLDVITHPIVVVEVLLASDGGPQLFRLGGRRLDAVVHNEGCENFVERSTGRMGLERVTIVQ